MTDNSYRWAVVGCQKKQIPRFARDDNPKKANVAGQWLGPETADLPPGLKRLRKKSYAGAPRGLESARRVENKRLRRWPFDYAQGRL